MVPSLPATLLTTAVALTAPVTFMHLGWQVPDGCPDANAVETRVRRLIGKTPPASPTPARVQANVWKDGSWHMELHVEVAGIASDRELNGNTCQTLAQAAALIIALSIAPDADPEPLGPLEASPRENAPTQPAGTAPDSPISPVSTATPPTGGLHVAARGLGRIARGEVAKSPVAAELAVAVYSERLRLEASVAYMPPHQRRRAGRGGEISRSSLGLRACYSPMTHIMGWAACGVAEGGLEYAKGVGITQPRSDSQLWVAPGVAVQLAYNGLAPVRLVLLGELLVPLFRPRYQIREEDPFGEFNTITVAQSAPTHLRLGIGAEMTIW